MVHEYWQLPVCQLPRCPWGRAPKLPARRDHDCLDELTKPPADSATRGATAQKQPTPFSHYISYIHHWFFFWQKYCSLATVVSEENLVFKSQPENSLFSSSKKIFLDQNIYLKKNEKGSTGVHHRVLALLTWNLFHVQSATEELNGT